MAPETPPDKEDGTIEIISLQQKFVFCQKSFSIWNILSQTNKIHLKGVFLKRTPLCLIL